MCPACDVREVAPTGLGRLPPVKLSTITTSALSSFELWDSGHTTPAALSGPQLLQTLYSLGLEFWLPCLC